LLRPVNAALQQFIILLATTCFHDDLLLPCIRARSAVMTGRIAALLLLLLLGCCGSPVGPARETPSPLPPPDLAAPPGPRLWQQLRSLHGRPQLCADLLARQTGWTLRRLPDTAPSPGCGLRGAVRVEASPLQLSRPLDLSCPLAASLHIWMRETVAPAARAHLGSRIISVETFGSYACRPRNNQKGARLSEHANANAIDISGFRLADGRQVRIRDLKQLSAREQAFVAAVRAGACQTVSVVLGPGSDGFHEDHLHLDLGPWRACR
jgi:hypothetical protein